MAGEVSPGLDALQDALNRGDITGMRQQLLSLNKSELDLLTQEIGSEAVERAVGAASRSRRSVRLGKVLVLPGIMGSLLDSVDTRGDADRVWVNCANLIGGQFSDLELTVPAGAPARAGVHVRTAGVHHKTYVPLLAELDTKWDVRPFAFDWREDIRKSAARLDGEIRAFGGGSPVHLVAHSMGGLVSRYLVRHFAQTWASMSDSDDNRAGGRLIMLGTPNRGSFAASLALTGGDKLVRRLALADLSHDLTELLSILTTFSGLYQMLPSPLIDLGGDDHHRLFNANEWPQPVHQDLLDRAQQFQLDLNEIIDADRMVYVAGFNQDTPVRIRIGAKKSFRYDTTRDGDGRVPHSLGLLDGVRTYYVEATHGDLPKNGQVLDAIHDLLATGVTTVLASSVPRRSTSQSDPRAAVGLDAAAEAAGDAEVVAIAGRSREIAAPEPTAEEKARLETLITEDYLGHGGEESLPRGVTSPAITPEKIEIEVVWGDVTRVRADLYSVGHYRGVAPQRAEHALDMAISSNAARAEGIIAAQTRRGALRADVGDISFFPWSQPAGHHRVVAVAGMGQPGSFDAAALRRLVKSTAIAAMDLPGVQTWCTVLIGSGEGTVEAELAALAWARGLADAVAETRSVAGRVLPKLVVAELFREQARRIAHAFREAASDGELGRRVTLKTSGRPRSGAGRRLSGEDADRLLIQALAKASGPSAPQGLAAARATLITQLPIPKSLRADVEKHLTRVAAEQHPSATVASGSVPTRISFSSAEGVICVAAINETATVPERVVPIDQGLLADLVDRMTDPPADQAPMLGGALYRFLVPHDFRSVVAGAGPFVFDVDRATARFHWEMCDDSNPPGSAEPLGVRSQVARQLRTTYSPASARVAAPRRTLRALVIGDPGDPEKRHDLPGARSEALAVYKLMLARGVDVDARIGAPSLPRSGPLAGIAPADRLDVLSLLSTGDYDVVHYAGHGDFDEKRPDRVGWLFASGLLTANEVQSLDQAPALIVANACLSARTSNVGADADPINEATRRALLVPSLADECLKLGVRDFIGTAWEVNDIGAEQFAHAMYSALLPHAGAPGTTIGEAVCLARARLWANRRLFGSLWAAYQHYGDPNTRLTIKGGEV